MTYNRYCTHPDTLIHDEIMDTLSMADGMTEESICHHLHHLSREQIANAVTYLLAENEVEFNRHSLLLTLNP